MKKIIIFLLIIGAGFYYSKKNPKEAQAPEVMADPVYVEARVQFNFPGNSVEGVMLGKTGDEADCRKHVQLLEHALMQQAQTVCPTCTMQPSACKTTLAPRYARLFDNQPAVVTYISMDRGDPAEREMRLIYWGVTVEQSDKLCDAVSNMQKGRKGTVRCIRSAR